MKRLLWILSFLPVLASADYQFEVSALGANIGAERELGPSTITLETEGHVSAYALRYFFSPVNTDVDALSIATFSSRSSWVGIYRTNTVSDLSAQGALLERDRDTDLDRLGASSRIFASDSIYFDIEASNLEDNSNREDSLSASPEPKPEDDKIFEFGAGYYINKTASIGASYELQDRSFASLSAYERTAKVYQESILTLDNGAKLFTKSTLSFEREEDKDDGSESREYRRGVEIIVDWLASKHVSLGGSFEIEWEELGRLYSLGPRLSFAIGESFLIEASYLEIQSDFRGEEELSGSILGLGLNARF